MADDFAKRFISRVEQLEQDHAEKMQELYDARIALEEATNAEEEEGVDKVVVVGKATARFQKATDAIRPPDMPHDHTIVQALFETIREDAS